MGLVAYLLYIAPNLRLTLSQTNHIGPNGRQIDNQASYYAIKARQIYLNNSQVLQHMFSCDASSYSEYNPMPLLKYFWS